MDGVLNKKHLMIWWILATTVGLFLGFALTTIISTQSYILASKFAHSFLIPLAVIGESLGGAAGGFILGFYQSQIIRRYIKDFNNKGFVIATVIAFILISLIVFNPIQFEPKGIVQTVIGIVFGSIILTSIGVAQWFILKQYFKKAYLWIPANAVAYLVGIPTAVFVMSIVPLFHPLIIILYAIIGGCMIGAIVGTITGFTLIKLISSQQP